MRRIIYKIFEYNKSNRIKFKLKKKVRSKQKSNNIIKMKKIIFKKIINKLKKINDKMINYNKKHLKKHQKKLNLN